MWMARSLVIAVVRASVRSHTFVVNLVLCECPVSYPNGEAVVAALELELKINQFENFNYVITNKIIYFRHHHQLDFDCFAYLVVQSVGTQWWHRLHCLHHTILSL